MSALGERQVTTAVILDRSGKLTFPGSEHYNEGSISLTNAVAMGSGVMICAGIFALTG